MNNCNLTQKENGDFYINDVKINTKIFEEEMIEYNIEEKDSIIDHLIDWISEATTDKKMMIEDLKYIIETKEKNDDLFFSSIMTNEYVFKSDNEGAFNDICQEILDLTN